MKIFFILGILSVSTITFACEALNFISPVRFALFQPAVPCITMIISILSGQENATFAKVSIE